MQTSDAIKLEGQWDPQFRHLYTMPSFSTLNFLDRPSDKGSHLERNLKTYNTPCIPLSFYRHQTPLARSVRGAERHASSLPFDKHQLKKLSTSLSQVDQDPPQPPSLLPDMRFGSVPHVPLRPHVPRPPNAFMLFRSDFLKKGAIPSHVERRQQNLSRIAGQCWNLLPAEEKQNWQEKAAKVLIEHQKQNPDYKFTPAPRGSRRTKNKGQVDTDGNEDRIRRIREEYTHIAGPTATPARRRRIRVQSRDVHKYKETISNHSQRQATHVSLPPPPTPSPPPLGHATTQGSVLPPFFPQHSFPHIITPRRPSTSLGLSTISPQLGNSPPGTAHIIRPASAASSESGLCDYLRDLDIASTFTHISTPSTTPVSTSPATPMRAVQHFSDALRETLPFTALNKCRTSSEPIRLIPHWDSNSGNNSSGSLSDALYLDCSFPSIVFPHDNQEHSIFEESHFYSTFEVSMPEEWGFSCPLAEVNHTYDL